MCIESRKVNVVISKAGGNVSTASVYYKVSIPAVWVKTLGISKENREVKLSFDGEKIIIAKV